MAWSQMAFLGMEKVQPKMVASKSQSWCNKKRMSIPKPARSYLKRHTPMAHLQLRVEEPLKERARVKAQQLDTSLNCLTEAAIRYYLDQLERKK